MHVVWKEVVICFFELQRRPHIGESHPILPGKLGRGNIWPPCSEERLQRPQADINRPLSIRVGERWRDEDRFVVISHPRRAQVHDTHAWGEPVIVILLSWYVQAAQRQIPISAALEADDGRLFRFPIVPGRMPAVRIFDEGDVILHGIRPVQMEANAQATAAYCARPVAAGEMIQCPALKSSRFANRRAEGHRHPALLPRRERHLFRPPGHIAHLMRSLARLPSHGHGSAVNGGTEILESRAIPVLGVPITGAGFRKTHRHGSRLAGVVEEEIRLHVIIPWGDIHANGFIHHANGGVFPRKRGDRPTGPMHGSIICPHSADTEQ
ncbi:MAG: hypothetical protein BWY76_01039 [bacterium ADurb.Bin429]|nr:MAG: hypothetical protein BWY76_01039 [bacterium ADurb.Bin429]